MHLCLSVINPTDFKHNVFHCLVLISIIIVRSSCDIHQLERPILSCTVGTNPMSPIRQISRGCQEKPKNGLEPTRLWAIGSNETW